MNIKELNTSIFIGLRNAYENSRKFNGYINPYVKPEYLLTVNVAQAISSDFDVIIKLEESTENLKMESADKCDFIAYFNYISQYKDIANLREGRIDLVLYEDEGKAVYPIEIKGFDTPLRNKQLLYFDIDRILIFLTDKTGSSNICFGTVAFIQELQASLESEIIQAASNIINEYSSILGIVYKDKLDSFRFEVYCEPIFNNLFKSIDEINSYAEEDSDDQVSFADAIDEKGLYAGIIINITKRELK